MAKRKALSVKQKLKIIKELNKGRKKLDVAREFQIAPSTVTEIIKNSKLYLRKEENDENLSVKKLRRCQFQQINGAVLQFFKDSRGRGVPLTGKILKAKAKLLAEEMSIVNFTASEGWLHKFKRKHRISFKSICGESADVSEESVNEWMSKIPGYIWDYEPNDIFNFDETGLFFKCLPQKTLAFKNDRCFGGKSSKLRITLGIGANMTGTEKLPMLVIGKSKKPRCFKNIKSLPVIYKSNKKAWMTSVIFEEYLQSLDSQFLNTNRKVLFFVDNCPAHPPTVSTKLKAIKLMFFPPNMTSKTQPMDLGIIKQLKQDYRQKLVLRCLKQLEESVDKEPLKLDVNLLEAISEVSDSWNSLPPKIIVNCFKKGGFNNYWNAEDNLPLSHFRNNELQQSNVDNSDQEIGEVSSNSIYIHNAWLILTHAFSTQESFQDYVNVDQNLCISNTESDVNDTVEKEEDFPISNDIPAEYEEPDPPTQDSVRDALALIYQKLMSMSNVSLTTFNEFHNIQSLIINQG